MQVRDQPLYYGFDCHEYGWICLLKMDNNEQQKIARLWLVLLDIFISKIFDWFWYRLDIFCIYSPFLKPFLNTSSTLDFFTFMTSLRLSDACIKSWSSTVRMANGICCVFRIRWIYFLAVALEYYEECALCKYPPSKQIQHSSSLAFVIILLLCTTSKVLIFLLRSEAYS